MTTRVELGAPRIYQLPAGRARAMAPGRMDVCAFVGVAPRGPAGEHLPTEAWREERPWAATRRARSLARAVESFDAYRELYGGFEGPGRLPYAVASFFEQGGRRAYVVRVVPEGTEDAGVAGAELPGVTAGGGPPRLLARSEGAWGNGLRAVLGFTVAPLPFRAATTDEVALDQGTALAPGALLRFALAPGVRALRFVAGIDEVDLAHTGGRIRRVRLEAPLPAPPRAVEVVEGVLLVDDGDGRRERHENLGLDAAHPRWVASVLYFESVLIRPDPAWVELSLRPEPGTSIPSAPELEGAAVAAFVNGTDRYDEIVPDHFFDREWTPGDPEPGDGVYALTHLADLASVVVPDLYVPEPLDAVEPVIDEVSLAGPEFAPCVHLQPKPEAQEPGDVALPGLQLDPRLPDDLERIVELQGRVVGLAERLRAFVVLLDVPPRLPAQRIAAWRRRFRSRYAAAYHPWLEVARPDDQRESLQMINPAAVAAGIIAARELAAGVPEGPANVIAKGVIATAASVPRPEHERLHQDGINVFLAERDGVRLTAARTLAADPSYRQLSVVRLVLMLKRALERQMQWVVFEPNGAALRAELQIMLQTYLGRLYRQGAFRGASEAEAFFVRVDASVNPPHLADLGRLVCEIGIAPSEPIEFILLRLTQADGTLTVEV